MAGAATDLLVRSDAPGPVTLPATEKAVAAAQTGSGLAGRAWDLWRMRSP